MEAPVRDPEPPSSMDVAELHLLIGELDDELTKYRWREAVWLSLIVHVVIFLAVIFGPKYFPKSAVIVPVTQTSKDQPIFLQAPPDQQHVKPPVTNIASDKNRIAQSPRPNPELLRKLLDANRAGPPAPKSQPPAPSQQAAQQQPAPAAPQAGAQNAPQPPQPTESAQLHTPAPGGSSSPFKTTGPGIQHAIDSLSASHGTGRVTFGGDYGQGAHPNTNMRGDVEILSDTMGVDFGPYLERVLYVIKKNWYNLIPEVARPPLMKKGKLIIQFAIMKDGSVQAMALQATSGDTYLDRAAWGGITASIPFDRLPTEFGGNYLALRIKFIYNSTIDDLN